MWCDHCDMPRAVCQHSVDKAVLAAFDGKDRLHEDLVADGPTITATQTTPCPGCLRKIQPEEQITHTEHGWAHAEHVGPSPKTEANHVDWSDFA